MSYITTATTQCKCWTLKLLLCSIHDMIAIILMQIKTAATGFHEFNSLIVVVVVASDLREMQSKNID